MYTGQHDLLEKMYEIMRVDHHYPRNHWSCIPHPRPKIVHRKSLHKIDGIKRCGCQEYHSGRIPLQYGTDILRSGGQLTMPRPPETNWILDQLSTPCVQAWWPIPWPHVTDTHQPSVKILMVPEPQQRLPTRSCRPLAHRIFLTLPPGKVPKGREQYALVPLQDLRR